MEKPQSVGGAGGSGTLPRIKMSEDEDCCQFCSVISDIRNLQEYKGDLVCEGCMKSNKLEKCFVCGCINNAVIQSSKGYACQKHLQGIDISPRFSILHSFFLCGKKKHER